MLIEKSIHEIKEIDKVIFNGGGIKSNDYDSSEMEPIIRVKNWLFTRTTLAGIDLDGLYPYLIGKHIPDTHAGYLELSLDKPKRTYLHLEQVHEGLLLVQFIHKSLDEEYFHEDKLKEVLVGKKGIETEIDNFIIDKYGLAYIKDKDTGSWNHDPELFVKSVNSYKSMKNRPGIAHMTIAQEQTNYSSYGCEYIKERHTIVNSVSSENNNHISNLFSSFDLNTITAKYEDFRKDSDKHFSNKGERNSDKVIRLLNIFSMQNRTPKKSYNYEVEKILESVKDSRSVSDEFNTDIVSDEHGNITLIKRAAHNNSKEDYGVVVINEDGIKSYEKYNNFYWTEVKDNKIKWGKMTLDLYKLEDANNDWIMSHSKTIHSILKSDFKDKVIELLLKLSNSKDYENLIHKIIPIQTKSSGEEEIKMTSLGKVLHALSLNRRLQNYYGDIDEDKSNLLDKIGINEDQFKILVSRNAIHTSLVKNIKEMFGLTDLFNISNNALKSIIEITRNKELRELKDIFEILGYDKTLFVLENYWKQFEKKRRHLRSYDTIHFQTISSYLKNISEIKGLNFLKDNLENINLSYHYANKKNEEIWTINMMTWNDSRMYHKYQPEELRAFGKVIDSDNPYAFEYGNRKLLLLTKDVIDKYNVKEKVIDSEVLNSSRVNTAYFYHTCFGLFKDDELAAIISLDQRKDLNPYTSIKDKTDHIILNKCKGNIYYVYV